MQNYEKSLRLGDFPCSGHVVYQGLVITPLIIDQIEKFQCLELSTAQGLSPGVLRSHVAHVTCPQTCLEVSQLYM